MAESTVWEFDPEERISVKNTCPWRINFLSVRHQDGDYLDPHEETTLAAEEILNQIVCKNKGFVGEDNMGYHAPIQLTNLDQYNNIFGKYFSSEKTKLPDYFSEADYKKMAKLNDKGKFQATLDKKVVTESDKRRLIYMFGKDKDTIRNAPPWMIWAIESFTNMKVGTLYY